MITINKYCQSYGLEKLVIAIAILCCLTGVATAQSSPFAPGWELLPEASAIRFQSVKDSTKVESNSFASFSGNIDTSGLATVIIRLDSIDTNVDLRNVRMRFLFFETFQYPEATITMQLEPTILSDLGQKRRKVLTLPYTLNLHGISKTMEAELVITEISEGIVSVSTSGPISISAADFSLDGGIKKLEETANVSIIPSATVTFNLLFSRHASNADRVATSAANATSAALEMQGDFSVEACKGRFEILSRTDNIYFALGSARLDPKSRLILDSIADIIRRCPGLVIEVSGHTDSDGSKSTNQVLSEKRAASVKSYLTSSGIVTNRIVTVGYGESKPVAPNDTVENKLRNRRIEFAVVDN
jgi:OOP family OmpA-OmpF porin